MDKETFARGAAVFGSSYIKRWLESRYDQLLELPFMAKLKAADMGAKYAIEALLYALTAYAENKMADTSPLWLVVKTILMDAAPEISARLLTDARVELNSTSTLPGQPEQSAANRLLALADDELLVLLLAIENMDEKTKEKFVAFAANASDKELRQFASLPPDQRVTFLGIYAKPNTAGNFAASFRSFVNDFWILISAKSHDAIEACLPVLKRYLAAVLQVLKACGVLLIVALLVCTASTLCERWSLLIIVIGILAASLGIAYFGKQTNKSWLSGSGIVSASVMAILTFIVASGYADAVFAISMFFLVGLPMMVLLAVLLPLTAFSEILRSVFRQGQRTLMRAIQMLVAAFLGVAIFSIIILIFPPQNPVAFLFIVPIVLVATLAVGMGLARISPEAFLTKPVLLSLGVIIVATIGIMSMPNLRHSLRNLPAAIDQSMVDGPTPVTFSSSSDIDFVNTNGEVRIWYAEKPGGGYDLFRCEGVGPYYAKDGRRLAKADSDTIRNNIADWVDQDAVNRRELTRRAEKLALEQRAVEERRARAEAEQQKESLRLAEQKQLEQEQLENTRKAEEQRRAEMILEERRKHAQKIADDQRRLRYLLSKGLPGKVGFIVSAATAAKEPMKTFELAIAKQLQRQGMSSSTDVFSQEFVTDGGFDSFFNGRSREDLRNMPLSDMGGKLFLARISKRSVEKSTRVSGLFTASVAVEFRIISTKDGNATNSFQLEAVGPGTSENGAIATALDRIVGQLSQQNY